MLSPAKNRSGNRVYTRREVEFVQLIKLVQQETGTGSERVRPPRLTVAGSERDEALAVIRERLARRPKM